MNKSYNSLEELRNEIDKCDYSLASEFATLVLKMKKETHRATSLLERRFAYCIEVARIKQQKGSEIFVPAREAQVVANYKKVFKEYGIEHLANDFAQEVMLASRNLQQEYINQLNDSSVSSTSESP